MSTEIIKVENEIYDITKDIIQDVSTESFEYLEFYDVNLNDVNSNDLFRIEVNDKDNYYLLHNAFVVVNFKITDDAGAAYAANASVSLQNNAVGLFKKWTLEFDDDIVETVDDAHICNTVQNFIYLSNEYSSTIAKSELWYPDTTATNLRDPAAFASVADLETVNYGHRKRSQLLNNGRIFSVQLPLKNIFGFVKSYKRVMRGVKIGLRLDRNSDNELILNGIGGGTNTGKVNMAKIQLFVPRVKPNLPILEKLKSQMSGDKNLFVPFVDAQIFRSNLYDQAPNNKLFQIKAKRRDPVKLYCVFQSQARYTGNKTINKRVFDHMSLTSLRVVVNALAQYPEREYRFNFVNVANSGIDYARIYNAYLQCGFHDRNINQGAVVKYDEFETLFPIFCVDMSHKIDFETMPESALIDVYISGGAANFFGYFIVESKRTCQFKTIDGFMRYIKKKL